MRQCSCAMESPCYNGCMLSLSNSGSDMRTLDQLLALRDANVLAGRPIIDGMNPDEVAVVWALL